VATIGYSFALSTLDFSSPPNGLIFQLEQHIIHEDPNVVPKLEDLWIPISNNHFEGGVHFYKLKIE
jgi:hypothetical protein